MKSSRNGDFLNSRDSKNPKESVTEEKVVPEDRGYEGGNEGSGVD